jgi:asparagine synthase (glutamine-hydrolysing)
MCGICGFISTAGWSSATLQAMNSVLARRGPDGEGSLLAGNVGLAMRRLAIIDIAGGTQPLYNEDGSVAVVFNGEIYNYKALREQLLARGHSFRTNSDTEVIVHLYEERGAELVGELEGMFAFALWDARAETLLLARDRLGIKPLFLAKLADGLLFASEIKSLLATGLVPMDLDWQAMDQFFAYTFIPGPRTIYSAIRKVSPGTTVTIGPKGQIRERSFWRVPDPEAVPRTHREWVARIDGVLQSAVRSHLVSDVPVGVFLSGGIDSSLIVAMIAQESERPVETFTVGFGDSGSSFIDDRIYARLMAQRYRLNHHEIVVEPRVMDVIPEIVAAFDEPFADDSAIPSYYISREAARYVKVALTGLGADELFGGYRRHLGVRLGDAYVRVPRWVRERLVDPLVRRLPEPKTSSDVIDHLKRFSRASSLRGADRYQDSMASLPGVERSRLYRQDLAQHIDSALTTEVLTATFDGFRRGNSVDRALKTDLRWYLSDDVLTLTDRLSMWHSLELRVPYLDHRLVEEAMTIPASLKIRHLDQKHILKEVAGRWLPEPIVRRRKQGFEAPMGRWLRGPLKETMQDTLSADALNAVGLFDSAEVERLKREHLSGARKHSKLLFSLLMFHLWYREHRKSALASAGRDSGHMSGNADTGRLVAGGAHLR